MPPVVAFVTRVKIESSDHHKRQSRDQDDLQNQQINNVKNAQLPIRPLTHCKSRVSEGSDLASFPGPPPPLGPGNKARSD